MASTSRQPAGPYLKTQSVIDVAPPDDQPIIDVEDGDSILANAKLERALIRKVDLRLCSIAGILCSLNLLDSGIISSASVTTIFDDLGLGVGNRYVSTSTCKFFAVSG